MGGTGSPFRHQLASTSPIGAVGLVRAAGAALGGDDPRERLARLLVREYGAAGLALVGSGTEALVLALRAAERIHAAEVPVAIPAFTCFDVASAAVGFGRPLRFYDVVPETLAPDPASLARALDAGARTVVVAPSFGVPVDWTALTEALARPGVVLIEDAAQGHGARWNGARLGTSGRLGVLSFGRGKGWTGGNGGALLIRNADDLAAVADLAPVGSRWGGSFGELTRAGAQWVLGRPGVYGIPRRIPALGLGETRYHDAPEPGAMGRAAAALLLHSFEAAEAEGRSRRTTGRRYAEELADAPGTAPVRVPTDATPGWIRFPVLREGGLGSLADPDRARTLGAAQTYPRPLPTLAQVATLAGAHAEGPWPGAARLTRDLLTLPTHTLLREAEAGALIRMLRERR